MRFSASLSVTAIAGNALHTGFSFTEAVSSTMNAVDALNTGFVSITDADGNPVVAPTAAASTAYGASAPAASLQRSAP